MQRNTSKIQEKEKDFFSDLLIWYFVSDVEFHRRFNGLTRRFFIFTYKIKQSNNQANDRMVTCNLCPRYCSIKEGAFGFCGIRTCRNGEIVLLAYGKNTGLAIDPIEKKPLNHFYPGSQVLSFGSIGCNFGCRFCQNWSTAHSRDLSLLKKSSTPEEIVDLAKHFQCRSVAFTYNEPIIGAEYVLDVARLCRREGIKTVAVSNGFIAENERRTFFDQIDAVNIDLKSFSDEFYQKYCNSRLEPVLETLCYLARQSTTWFEVTTLLIPTLNDSDAEIELLSQWLVRNLGVETPVHFSAFHPAYQLTDLPPTPPQTLFRAREIAHSAGLCFVYTGNINDPAGQTTYCPQCRQSVISRNRYRIDEYNIDTESCCRFCGQTISGQFEEE
ncbi:MAG: AmmeMemoRadiSam system radical SAM enzyme [Planctomycetaceae bacterium]|jgi:pyruvate formate lyase activating enzyme|nr:AmmeMemoRadiSam system radical SAM enzyme [Planctomycetaceae bacterium]